MPYKKNTESSLFTLVKAVLSVLLGFLAFASICVFIVLTVFRQNNIESFIKEIDLAWVIEDIGLQDDIANVLNEIPDFHPVFDADGVDEFIKRDTVSNELNSIVDGYLNAFIEGDFDHHVTHDDIIDIAKNLEPEILDQFGIEMTEEDYRILSQALEDIEEFETLRIGNLFENENMDMAYFIHLYTFYPLVITGILCVIFLFNIYLVNWKSTTAALTAMGVPVLLAGLATLSGPAVILYSASFSEELATVLKYFEGPVNLFFQRGIAVAAVGAILIVSSVVISIMKKQRKTQPASIPEGRILKVRLFTGIGVNAAMIATAAVFIMLFLSKLGV